ADRFKAYRQKQAAERSALDAVLGLEPSDDPNVGFNAAQSDGGDSEARRAYLAEQEQAEQQAAEPQQQPQQAQPAQRVPFTAEMGALNQAVSEAQRAIDYIGAEMGKAYPEIFSLPPEQRQQALWEGYQRDPVRFAPAFAAINKANEIAIGTAQAVQYAQAQEAQRIQSYGEAEDEKFAR